MKSCAETHFTTTISVQRVFWRQASNPLSLHSVLVRKDMHPEYSSQLLCGSIKLKLVGKLDLTAFSRAVGVIKKDEENKHNNTFDWNISWVPKLN